jgi:hypothetical protein
VADDHEKKQAPAPTGWQFHGNIKNGFAEPRDKNPASGEGRCPALRIAGPFCETVPMWI